MGHFDGIPEDYNINSAVSRLAKVILDTLDFNEVVQKVVDSIFDELGYLNLGYKIIVLALIDKDKGVLRRISVSHTPEGKIGAAGLPIPFTSVEIPLSAKDNFCIQAIEKNTPYTTHFWPDILTPPIPREEAILLQKEIGIQTSIVYPVGVHGNTIGIMIFSMVKEESQVTPAERNLLVSFTDLVGLAVQNSRLYSSLARTSEEVRVANEKLKEVDKLKDEFVSLASHELRTPMSIIKSYTWVLLQNKIGVLNEKQNIYLSRIASTTDRLINLVNDMLNVSRIESGRFTIEPAKVDIGKLLSDAVTEMQSRAQEFGVTLMYKGAEALPQVKADMERTKQVLINLIGNSFKFTPKTGTIIIEAIVIDGGFVRVSVIDNGRGISATDLQRLFQKFNMVGKTHLTKQAGQGTGLGLYLSKSLIELQGGRIWASSPGEGKGSVFSFTLPVWMETASQTTEGFPVVSPAK